MTDPKKKENKNPHGGVLILIHNSLQNFRLPVINTLDHLEAAFIELFIGSKSLKIASIYSTSSLTIKQSNEQFAKLLNISGPVVLAGDFNAKHSNWGNESYNFKGVGLNKLCSTLNFDIHYPDSPTQIPARGEASVIDFVISKGIIGILKPEIVNFSRSDHLPIEFSIPFSVTFPKELKIKNFPKANWKLFKNLTKNDLSSSNLYETIDSPQKIDDCIEHFTETLLRAEEKSVPLKKPYIFRYPESEEIKQLIRDRNRSRKYSAKFPILRKTVNYLNRLIKTKTAQLNADKFNERLKDLKVSDMSLYRFARAIKNKRTPIPPLKSTNGEIFINEQGKADVLAETFRQSHIISDQPTLHSAAVNDSIAQLVNLSIDIPRYEKVKLNDLKEDI